MTCPFTVCRKNAKLQVLFARNYYQNFLYHCNIINTLSSNYLK